MPDSSAILSLPYILPSQAQKHVTHNEALQILDAVVQLAVEDRDLSVPPTAPEDGARFIVASGASGAWAGHEGQIALYDMGAWVFFSPVAGWRAFVIDEGVMLTWRDESWKDDSDLSGQLAELGINAAPDSTNRLTVSSSATLLNNAGSGHQLKINKASSADTASLLFQSAWTGYAEMGLAGNNSFSIKVSGNGSSWTTALSLDSAGKATGAAVQSSSTDTTSGRLMSVGAFGLGNATTGVGAPGDDANSTLAAGFYTLTSSGTNCPVVDPSGGSLVVTRSHANSPRQIFISAGGAQIWLRGYASGSWTPWVEILTRSTMVGTVSQSSGSPTGSIVETGTNANGTYVRWADGTQICTNGNAAITTNPAVFTGTVTSVDSDKLRIGRWY